MGRIAWITGFWALIILLLSVIPGEDLPSISIWEADKMAHAFVYALLCFGVILTLRRQSFLPLNRFKGIIFAFLLCNLYGWSIECIQGEFLANRTFDVYDLMANGIGCFLAVTGSLIIFKPY